MALELSRFKVRKPFNFAQADDFDCIGYPEFFQPRRIRDTNFRELGPMDRQPRKGRHVLQVKLTCLLAIELKALAGFANP